MKDYNRDLTFSMMNKQNIKRAVLKTDEKLEKVSQNYIHCTNIRQRVDPTIHSHDQTIINGILESSELLMEEYLPKCMDEISNYTVFSNINEVFNLFGYGSQYISDLWNSFDQQFVHAKAKAQAMSSASIGNMTQHSDIWNGFGVTLNATVDSLLSCTTSSCTDEKAERILTYLAETNVLQFVIQMNNSMAFYRYNVEQLFYIIGLCQLLSNTLVYILMSSSIIVLNFIRL